MSYVSELDMPAVREVSPATVADEMNLLHETLTAQRRDVQDKILTLESQLQFQIGTATTLDQALDALDRFLFAEKAEPGRIKRNDPEVRL